MTIIVSNKRLCAVLSVSAVGYRVKTQEVDRLEALRLHCNTVYDVRFYPHKKVDDTF